MARVKVDLSGVNKKLSAGNIQSAKYGMMNQMLMDIQPFVPNSGDGTLQQVGVIGANRSSLVWNLIYAKPMYYGVIKNRYGSFPVSKWTTPGTGPYWDLRAKGLYMNDWQKVFLRGLNL